MPLLTVLFAIAAQVPSPHSSAILVASVTSYKPGQPFLVGVRIKMDSHWHSYWRNPGDSGLPTTIDWHLPKGWKAGPILWPTPKIVDTAGITGFGYDDQVLLATRITPPVSATGSTSIRADVKWLICANSCLPARASVAMTLKPGPATPNKPWGYRLKEVLENQPTPISQGISASTGNGTIRLIVPFADIRKKFATMRFFPYDPAVLDHAAAQNFNEKLGILELRLKVSEYARDPKRLRGVLVCYGSQDQLADSSRPFGIDVPIKN